MTHQILIISSNDNILHPLIPDLKLNVCFTTVANFRPRTFLQILDKRFKHAAPAIILINTRTTGVYTATLVEDLRRHPATQSSVIILIHTPGHFDISTMKALASSASYSFNLENVKQQLPPLIHDLLNPTLKVSSLS